MAQNKVQLIIEANAKAAAAEFKKFSSQARASMNQISDAAFSAKGAIAGLIASLGVKRIVGGFLETAQAMDAMKISLDTITKGKGEETFRRLNEWAMKMPVDTAKATQAYIQMRAMGLEPTIDQMTTLVDTMGALGGGPDMLDTFANTLGKIKALGKVSADEINRLAERGVPAFEILQQKFNLTAKQLGDLGNAGLDADAAIQALLEGMAQRFAGQSDKLQKSMAGMWETIKSEYTDYERRVMESGVTAYINAGLQSVIDKINELKKSGDFGPMINDMADNIMTATSFVLKATAAAADAWRGWQMIWEWLKADFSEMASVITSKMQEFVKTALAASRAFGMDSMTKKLEAASRELGIAQEYFAETVEESAKAIEEMASKKSAYVQVSETIDTMREAAEKARKELEKVKESAPEDTKWTSSVSMKISAPPEVKKYWEEQKKAIKDYESVAKDVQDKIKEATLSTEDYKIWKVRQWEKEAIAAAKKAGKDTTKIEQAASLEIAQIKIEGTEAKIKADQDYADELDRQVKKEISDAQRVLEAQISAKRAMYEDLKAFGVENHAFQLELIEQQAASFRAALAGNQQAEALVDQWRLAEIQRVNEARFEKEHEVMTALKESWGLTWEEIRENQVNVWMDIGQAMASATQSAASHLTDALMRSRTLGEAMDSMFKDMARQGIQAILKIMAQQVIMSIAASAMGKALAASQVANMTAINAAATPAAVTTSIATAGGSATAGSSLFALALAAMSAAASALMGMFSKAATGGIFTRPTYTLMGEDGDEAIIPLSRKYRSQGQALFEQIAPIFLPEPVMAGGGMNSGGVASGAARSAPANRGGDAYNIIVENHITINGDMESQAGVDKIAKQLGESVENAVKGALN